LFSESQQLDGGGREEGKGTGRRTWKFQKCEPVQLAYPPNWRVMTSPSLEPMSSVRSRVTQPALRDLKKTIEKIAITTANLFFLLLYHD
jgi:hypothetical protein